MDSDKKNTTEISKERAGPISFFEKDVSFVFAFKKTEKLASAVYMVTSLFSDNEPMKWTLRKKISDLVSFIITYKDVTESARSNFIYSVRTSILEIVSLLEISQRGGLISTMNFSILKDEFSNLGDIFSLSESSPKELYSNQIPKTFFDISSQNSDESQNNSSRTSNMSDSFIKDRTINANKSDLKRSDRQNTILALIRKKKELTIKDIAAVIKDCSEKTIQRELIAFISAGILKRTGERRWSKYSFNQ